MPGALDRNRERPLVPRAGAGLPSRLDLAPIGHVAPQPPKVFVVDDIDVIHAEATDFTAWIVASAASPTTATEAPSPWRSAIAAIAALPWATISRAPVIWAARPVETSGSRISLFRHRCSLLFRLPARLEDRAPG